MKYDRGSADETGLRPIIQEFAKAMESKLASNDHKDHWRKQGLSVVYSHFQSEVREFNEAVSGDFSIKDILSEACDVALTAMMCVDIIKSMGERK